MVEFSFDRDEFRPDPSDRRREAERREEREREMDRQRQEDAFRAQMEREAQEDAIRRVVNDPNITVDETMATIINDPSMMMDKDMVVRRRRGDFSQFSRANLLRGSTKSSSPRTRKKTKTDKNMSKALREANNRMRTKAGKLRKGKSMADVMRLAHRLRRKMK